MGRMFGQSVAGASILPPDNRDALIARLDRSGASVTSAVPASETTWTPFSPSTPSARTVPPSADNPDSSSDITLHAALPETHDSFLDLACTLEDFRPACCHFPVTPFSGKTP